MSDTAGQMADPILHGVLVVELGGREGVATCGLLLAQLGASVVVVEPNGEARMRDAHRAQFLAGKCSVALDEAVGNDQDFVQRLVARSDIVLTSSDVDGETFTAAATAAGGIVCDITAFGPEGPLAGSPYTEMQIQACSGLMDTTGEAGRPPVPIALPIVGYLSGTYAAAAVLAAWRVRRLQGFSQRIDISMFECAFLTLNAFLSGVLTGQASDRTRMGNRHPSVAPWNVYRTADGHVLICVGNDAQWARLSHLLGHPGNPEDFATQSARIANVDALDRIVTDWTSRRTTMECVEAVLAIDVPTGPITPIDQYPREPNIDYRAMIRTVTDPRAVKEIAVSGTPLKLSESPLVQPETIPAIGADRDRVEALLARRDPVLTGPAPERPDRPLAGLRVIELGQYTSAPLCARHLAHLGAEVIKIEQPGGDAQRSWVPHIGGQSATFRLNNTDKRSMVLDLRSADGRDTLRSLLASADVVVENMRPGTLAKYGFSAEQLAQINPRLVYCDINGFGATSLYDGRPAFDMVVQAMSGFMAAVRPNGLPLKSGISAADQMVAELGIVGTLAALDAREQTGRGQHVDASMQDVTCWVTAPSWNAELASIAVPFTTPCADGYLMVEASQPELASALEGAGLDLAGLAAMSRHQASEKLEALGLVSAPVLSIKDAAELPQTRACGTWFTLPEAGLDWPVLACPLRLRDTPPRVERLIGTADSDGEVIRDRLAVPSGQHLARSA